MYPLAWSFYCVFISVIVACITFAVFWRKTRGQDSTPAEQRVRFLNKYILPGRKTGWCLKAIDNGLRIWEKTFQEAVPSWVSGTVYSCSGIIPSSVQEAMAVLKDEQLMLEWCPGIKDVSRVNIAGHSDVVSITPSRTGVMGQFVHRTRESCGLDNSMVYTRHWSKKDTEAWLFSSALQLSVPAEGLLWTCFIITSLQSESEEFTECLLTIVVSPVSSSLDCIQNLTSCSMAGLQDLIGLTRLKCSVSASNPSMQATDAVVVSQEENILLAALPENQETRTKNERMGLVNGNTAVLENNSHLASGPSPRTHSYLAKETEAVEALMQAYRAQEGSDGWTMVGNMKGVEIQKRPAQPGERPWDCLKGTTTIATPIHYILAYVFSLDYRKEWDDLFLKGEVIEAMDLITKVTRMEYKPVWPASGRDFCNLAVLREVSPNIYGLAVTAVEHLNCPPMSGLVRAELMVAGFVVKELCSDPPSCDVTYITRADLKGNLPVRLVNRVTSSQPQALAILRDKLEARYREDQKNEDTEMSTLQKESIDYWMELIQDKESRAHATNSSTVNEDEGEVDGEERSIVDSIDSEIFMQPANVRSRLAAAEITTESGEPLEVPDENTKLPLAVGRHRVDFRTLGNQNAANLLGELVLASKVEISGAEDYSIEMKEGEWSFHSVEKDVVISRKVSPGQEMHSFLGKGMIKVSPPVVWNAIRNTKTRHVYDRMLKKAKVVKTIDEQTKIVYYHHETTQCFVKQSRDFVLLVAERPERERYVVAGASVEVPECPEASDIIRGKVYSSGWVIEPVLQDGHLYSMVSYLSQVDFGGAVPVRLLNHIARRQPLCIAYLREYLEKVKEVTAKIN